MVFLAYLMPCALVSYHTCTSIFCIGSRLCSGALSHQQNILVVFQSEDFLIDLTQDLTTICTKGQSAQFIFNHLVYFFIFTVAHNPVFN